MTIGAGGANVPARAFLRVFTVIRGLSPGGLARGCLPQAK
jgi:hypothetical protein